MSTSITRLALVTIVFAAAAVGCAGSTSTSEELGADEAAATASKESPIVIRDTDAPAPVSASVGKDVVLHIADETSTWEVTSVDRTIGWPTAQGKNGFRWQTATNMTGAHHIGFSNGTKSFTLTLDLGKETSPVPPASKASSDVVIDLSKNDKEVTVQAGRDVVVSLSAEAGSEWVIASTSRSFGYPEEKAQDSVFTFRWKTDNDFAIGSHHVSFEKTGKTPRTFATTINVVRP